MKIPFNSRIPIYVTYSDFDLYIKCNSRMENIIKVQGTAKIQTIVSWIRTRVRCINPISNTINRLPNNNELKSSGSTYLQKSCLIIIGSNSSLSVRKFPNTILLLFYFFCTLVKSIATPDTRHSDETPQRCETYF